MEQLELLSLILDSWNEEVVFIDTNHIIQYVNAPAVKKYAKWGDMLGKSIFFCHNPNSCQMIRDMFVRFQNGENDILFVDSEKHRVYMRAVRDKNGALIGYYERFEPPAVKKSVEKPDFHG
jgi:DUF438 domain-containing protein